jgi:hypothetical protein
MLLESGSLTPLAYHHAVGKSDMLESKILYFITPYEYLKVWRARQHVYQKHRRLFDALSNLAFQTMLAH